MPTWAGVFRSLSGAVSYHQGTLSYGPPSPDFSFCVRGAVLERLTEPAKITRDRDSFISINTGTPHGTSSAFPLPFPLMSANILVSRVLGIPIVDVSTTTIDPTQGAFAVANNLRVASLSIAAYEYVTSYVSSKPHSNSVVAQLFPHSRCRTPAVQE
jgi:hypothetical protein